MKRSFDPLAANFTGRKRKARTKVWALIQSLGHPARWLRSRELARDSELDESTTGWPNSSTTTRSHRRAQRTSHFSTRNRWHVLIM